MSPAYHLSEHRPSLTSSFGQRDNSLEDPTAISCTDQHRMETNPLSPAARRKDAV